MKIVIVFLFLLNLIGAFAQGEAVTEKSDEQKVRIFVSPDQQLIKQADVQYKGEKASLVDWEELDEKRFLNIERWKVDLKVKENEPRWRRNLQERRLMEKVGYVIECVGNCRLYRGVGYSKVDYLSTLREGDELQTLEDSYLWAYFLDGTLVRMSPNGSITLKEINIGMKENFIFTRLNAGNILLWGRNQRKFEPLNFKETDSLFLPLSFLEANPKDPGLKLDEENLFGYLEKTLDHFGKYKRLNELIEENKREEMKPTEFFLVMPNGTIQGSQMIAEFIVLPGNKSYFKLRSHKQAGLVGEESHKPGTFYFRGYNNTETSEAEVGQWYEVGAKGRTLSPLKDIGPFGMGEFVTRNIPTILIAREIFYKKYSGFAHQKIGERQLAEGHGYRLWGDKDKEGSDLNLRLKFLHEYTRRTETNNLVVSEQFKKRLERRGEKWSFSEYSQNYYRRAIGDFYNYREGANILSGKGSSLNSERKPFWKKIHGIKQ
jgi:hypothetical protein